MSKSVLMDAVRMLRIDYKVLSAMNADPQAYALLEADIDRVGLQVDVAMECARLKEKADELQERMAVRSEIARPKWNQSITVIREGESGPAEIGGASGVQAPHRYNFRE